MKKKKMMLLVLVLAVSMAMPMMGVTESEIIPPYKDMIEEGELSTEVDIELPDETGEIDISGPELPEVDVEITFADDDLELTESDLIDIYSEDIGAGIDETTSNVVSDWVEMSQVPEGATIVETKTQYQYSDIIYSDWSGWSLWDINRQATDDLKKEESATVWYWYHFVCPHCGAKMHVWNKCYTWAGGCGGYIGIENANVVWLPAGPNAGTKNWLGTGKTMLGFNSKDRWFYWTDASQGYPNGRSETGYRYATRTKSWGPWSDWSDTAVTASDTRMVQTRTMCRYEDGDNPAEGMYLDRSSATLSVGETMQLFVGFTPADAFVPYSWMSSDPSVAYVDSNGIVAAINEGYATITAYTEYGFQASCDITVILPVPTDIQLNRSEASVVIGNQLKLEASVIPSNARTTIAWSSSNKKIATVGSDGTVKALKEGTAVITAETGNGLRASCTVRVLANSKVIHRALLIGQVSFPEVCNRNKGDVKLMASMLSSRQGAAGGYYKVTTKYDLTAQGVLNAIYSTFGSADSNDVSLFFIATHGDDSSSGKNAGSLGMPKGRSLLLTDLAYALNSIPGKVIVILESCGSGAAIYANGENAYNDMKERATEFDEMAIKAFSDIDDGLYADSVGNVAGYGEITSNTGEFRKQNKFYVLTASRYQETSWGSEVLKYNYFTKWLTNGVGKYGKMKADTNKNGVTTLNELFRYISKVGDKYKIRYKGRIYYQHVQVYPSYSSFALFKK